MWGPLTRLIGRIDIQEAASAVGNVFQRFAELFNRLGNTWDGGGTASAGTLMAKSNAVIAGVDAANATVNNINLLLSHGHAHSRAMISVQRGFTALNSNTRNIIISAVDISRSFVNFNFARTQNLTINPMMTAQLSLPNHNSSVHHIHFSQPTGFNNVNVSWEVITFL